MAGAFLESILLCSRGGAEKLAIFSMFDMSILYCEKDNKKSRRDDQTRLLVIKLKKCLMKQNRGIFKRNLIP